MTSANPTPHASGTIKPIAWALSAALIVALLATMGYELIIDRRTAESRGFADASNLAELLSQHAAETFGAVDQALTGIVDQVDTADIVDPSQQTMLHRMLRARLTLSPNVYAFYILDAKGRLAHASLDDRFGTIDFSGRPLFETLRQTPDAGLFISRPVTGPGNFAEGRQLINMGYRLNNPDGSFAGVAAAAVSLDALQKIYDLVRIGPRGVASLISLDGILLVRSPYIAEAVGLDISQSAGFRAHPPTASGASFYTSAATDGITRLSTYRIVQNRPLVVYVGLARDDVFGDWDNQLQLQIFLAIVLSTVIAGFTFAATTGLTRWRRDILTHEARLNQLVDASGALLAMRDMDALLKSSARLARDLIGAHQCVVMQIEDGIPVAHVTDLSDRYSEWHSYADKPTGAGIYRLVYQQNRIFRMTQAEMEQHPDYLRFSGLQKRHPPLRGWLAVPLTGIGGNSLGMIQLSDKYDGDFDSADQSLLMQIGQIVVSGIQTIRLLQSVDSTRQQAERAAQTAQEKTAEIESIFAAMSDAFFSVDRHFRFTYINRRAEPLLQRRASELIGTNLWEEFPEARQTVVWEIYHAVVEKRERHDFTFYYDPLKIWFDVRAFPHGNGMSVYFRDITEQRRMDEELRQAQKMEAIGQLTGGVAHDFNSLLTVILGNADMLRERLRGNDRLHQLADLIHAAGERAADLTRSLLAFARRQSLTPEPVDLQQKLKILRPLLFSVLEPGMQLDIDIPSALPRVMIDRQQFDTAVLNLVINARDAMPGGGTVRIDCGILPLDDQIAAQNPEATADSYVAVSVSDTGTGMPADVAARIFEPFFTTKPLGQGTGLGLSMVYGFVKQSRGHVKLRTAPGEGTTITLYLPQA